MLLLALLACTDSKLSVYNAAPEVTITRPTAGQPLLDLDAVVLEARVSDPQSRNDELTYVLSDRSGPVDVVPELPDDETVHFQLPTLAPVFTSVTVRESATAGLYAIYASPTVVDSSLVDNLGHGADLSVFSTFPTFSGNTVTGNGGHPVSLPATSLDALDATSTYTGNAEDSVAVAGYAYVIEDATWSLLDVPYDMQVRQPAAVLLQRDGLQRHDPVQLDVWHLPERQLRRVDHRGHLRLECERRPVLSRPHGPTRRTRPPASPNAGHRSTSRSRARARRRR